MGGRFSEKVNHFMAPTCKLRLARFSARLKKGPSVVILSNSPVNVSIVDSCGSHKQNSENCVRCVSCQKYWKLYLMCCVVRIVLGVSWRKKNTLFIISIQ